MLAAGKRESGSWLEVLRLLLKYAVTRPLLLATAAVLAVLLGLGSVIAMPTMNAEPMNLALEYLPSLREQVESGMYDSAPEDLRESTTEELAALERMSSAADESETIRAYERYLELLQGDYDAGYINGGQRWGAHEQAELSFYQALSSIDKPEVYASTTDEPALYRLSSALASVPGVAWALPAVVSAAEIAGLRRRGRALVQAPGGVRLLWAELLSAWLAAVLAGVLSWLPTLLVSGARAGFGDPRYPVVFVWAGQVVQTTVLETVTRTFALQAVGALLVVAVCELVGRCLPSFRLASFVAGVSLLLASTTATGLAATPAKASASPFALAPFPYLIVSEIARYPESVFFSESIVVAGTSFEKGMWVLTLWSAAVVVALAVVIRRRTSVCL